MTIADDLLFSEPLTEAVQLGESISRNPSGPTVIRRRALVMACCEVAALCGWARPLPSHDPVDGSKQEVES